MSMIKFWEEEVVGETRYAVTYCFQKDSPGYVTRHDDKPIGNWAAAFEMITPLTFLPRVVKFVGNAPVDEWLAPEAASAALREHLIHRLQTLAPIAAAMRAA